MLARSPEELATLPAPRLEVVDALEAAEARPISESAAGARKALATLAEREPRSPTVRFHLGNACRDDGRRIEETDPEKAQRSYEEALGHFTAVLERRRGHPGALNLSIWCLHKLGRFEAARSLAQAALDEGLGDGDTHFFLGALYSTKEAPFYDLARAEQAALQALERDPTSTRAQELLRDIRSRR
jgi:tetratricopeptide (TPR) repeat protein